MSKKMMGVGAFLKAGGGTYEDYMKAAKAGGMRYADEDTFKAEVEVNVEDEDEDEDEDEGEEEEEETEKSFIDPSDLMKSLDAFDTIDEALASSDTSRTEYLEQRLYAGTITKSERQELGRLWNGDGETFAKSEAPSHQRRSIVEHIRDDSPESAELINGNDFLKSLVEGVEETLDMHHRERLTDSQSTRQLVKAQGALLRGIAQHNITLTDALNKSLAVIDRLNDRLDAVERSPAPSRAVGTHDPRAVRGRRLAKSGAAPAQGDTLQKSQMQAGIRSLLEKAQQAGDSQAIDRLIDAGARIEQGFSVPANIEQAIRMEIGA